MTDIIKSKRNQLANTSNQYQGSQPKILCLCSAGLLRSATIADILVKSGKYNVRNAGCSQEYALIPLSTALLEWADTIIVVKEWETFINSVLVEFYMTDEVNVISIDIPDEYSRNDPTLINIITDALTKEGIL